MTDTNKISQRDLETITQIAKAYNFRIRFNEELNKWIVDGYCNYGPHNFYWDSTETVEQFFSDLKQFFWDEGSESLRSERWR